MKHAMIVVVGLFVIASAAALAADEPVTPKEKTMLWNGKDFTGWKLFLPGRHDVTKTWSVEKGIYKCTGRPGGYMRTETSYANYKLHVEWRWPGRGGNSGVLLHMVGPDKVWPKSLECQLQSGNAGDFWSIGGIEFKERAENEGKRTRGRHTRKLEKSSEKPLGEWNSYDIICKGDNIRVLVNGVLQNVATDVSVAAGRICLQSEGTPIEFRNMYIEPVEK